MAEARTPATATEAVAVFHDVPSFQAAIDDLPLFGVDGMNFQSRPNFFLMKQIYKSGIEVMVRRRRYQGERKRLR